MEKEKDGLPITTLREIKFLSRLSHPNLICLEEVAVGPVSDQFFLVFEYAKLDMADILDSKTFVAGKTLTIPDIKTLLLQLLSVVDYLHTRYVLHRDIKVSNMLYFGESGTMKLADFGLARSYTHFVSEPLTPETVTLWYRSPEILLNAAEYGPSADMWSVGCVFAELLTGQPLFPGDTLLDQFTRMSNLLGPMAKEWPEVQQLSDFVKHNSDMPDSSVQSNAPFLQKFSAKTGSKGLDLLSKLLKYNPKERITAAAALQHEWFTSDPLPTPTSQMPSFQYIQRKYHS